MIELSPCSRTWDWVWTPIEDGNLDPYSNAPIRLGDGS